MYIRLCVEMCCMWRRALGPSPTAHHRCTTNRVPPGVQPCVLVHYALAVCVLEEGPICWHHDAGQVLAELLSL